MLDVTRDSITGATQGLSQVPEGGRLLALAQDAFTTGLAHGIYAALALTLLVTTSTLRLLPAGKAGRGADIPDACSLLPDRPIPEPTHL